MASVMRKKKKCSVSRALENQEFTDKGSNKKKWIQLKGLGQATPKRGLKATKVPYKILRRAR